MSGQLPKITESVEQTRTQVRASQEEQAFRANYQRDASEFARTQPAFAGQTGAYQFLLNTRGAQLKMQGYPEEEIPGMVLREERSLVERARAQKKNPGEMLYNLAVSFGFKPAAPVEMPRGGGSRPGWLTAGQISLEALSNLSEREFEALYSKHGAEIEKMLGRAA
jgi:hypothetical protein